jgi:hypothetical protein
MSILRYFNKHHGWYDGKRTPYAGPEEAIAAPLILEAIAPEAVGGALTAAEVGGVGAGVTDAALLGGEYAGGLGATGYGAGVTSGAALGGEYAADELARQAAMQGGNSALANVPVDTTAGPINASPYANTPVTPSVTPSTGGLTPEQMRIGSGVQGIGPNLAGTAGGNIPATGLSQFIPSQNQLMVGGGLYALNSMMNADRNRYSVPAAEKYTGPLNKMRYNPDTYQYNAPVNRQYTPNYAGYAGAGYAEGGITQLPQDKNFASGGMYPGSQIDKTQYSSSPQTPMSMQATMASYDPETNPLTGEPTTHMAKGGIAGLLKGQGDGMSDSIHATIADKQPARLADGEFVIPADVVSHLGNGSTDAGAKHLYKMMDKVRHARTGSKKQGKQIAAGGYLPIK